MGLVVIVLLVFLIGIIVIVEQHESGDDCIIHLKEKEEYYIKELCKICEHLKIYNINVCDISHNYYSLWYSFDYKTKTVTKSIIRRNDEYKIITEYTNKTFMTKDLYKKFVEKCTNQ